MFASHPTLDTTTSNDDPGTTLSPHHRLRPSVSASSKKNPRLELMSKSRGLGAIEQFKRKGFHVVAYEARDSVGGLW